MRCSSSNVALWSRGLNQKLKGQPYNLVAKVHDWDPERWWFKPQYGHDKIHAAVGPLSKALNLALL